MPYVKIYYHFIWATKERIPLIEPSFEPDLYRAVASKVQKMDGFVHAIGGTEDHIHLAASIPPKLAPAIFIGEEIGRAHV